MSFSGQWSPYSWVVIIVYMIFTTWLGKKLAGRQATIRDFFLGGRKLPWYAICGSIIATELSAMTLVGVPAFLWAETGNMTYAILGLGTILARIIVGFVFVPRYYDEEIYSPYEYIGNRLGERARRVTSLLFMVGGMLGQGARVLLAAIVLNVVLSYGADVSAEAGIHISIWIVGAFAILWTYMGGIRTVIWTDVIQFVIFTLSAALTLIVVVSQFHTPAGESGGAAIWNLASEAGKLKWLDLSLDPRKEFTLLTGLVASTLAGLAAYGTDQMMVQRMFCCKGPREARRAIIVSSVSQILMIICLFVGVGLWAIYVKGNLAGATDEIKQINANENALLPVFIKNHVHWFFGGIMVAGIFAAAISTLESVLAALSQQTLETLQRVGKIQFVQGHEKSETEAIRLSRLFVIFWGIVLCGMASMFQIILSRGGGGLLIVLALTLVGYTAGGILGTFLMALIPGLRRSAAGMEWSAVLSILTIFALRYHEPAEMFGRTVNWTLIVIISVGVLLAVSSILLLPRIFIAPLTIAVFTGIIIFLNQFQAVFYDSPVPAYLTLSFPWLAPLGALVMIVSAQLICEPAVKVSQLNR